jgi:predicted acetyltransferase
MEIRFARKEDKPVLKNLWGYCFTDGDAYIRWNFDHRYREENTLVSVEDGEICGMVQLIPGRFWMDEVEINASFVEGVAVAPHKRSCGVAKELMQAAFGQMKQRGHSASFLIPFSASFYQKLGYGTCTYLKKARLNMGSIRRYPAEGNWRIARMDEQTIHALDGVYRAYCKDKNCYQLRGRREWECILQDAALSGGNVFLLERDSQAVGYLNYILQDETLQVNEMCYADYGAFGGIMDFIRRHSPQADRVLLRAAPNDPAVREFMDLKDAVSEFSYAMMRIIDAEAVLKSLSRHFYGEAVIRIADAQCTWNEGLYQIGENETVRLEGEEAGDVVSMDVGALAELAAGAVSLEEARYLGMVQGEIKTLDGLFQKRQNFMNLMFE